VVLMKEIKQTFKANKVISRLELQIINCSAMFVWNTPFWDLNLG